MWNKGANGSVKADFHSHISLVDSEIFRIGHAQIVKPIKSDGKISFTLFIYEVQIFQLLRNSLAAKPIRFLS